MYNEKWFTSRILEILGYQKITINKVWDSLHKQEITILAACPSSGKTLMVIQIIEEYIKENPDHKILVLAHGTDVLRSQFYNVCVKYKPNFTFKLVRSKLEYDSNIHVNITLPQTAIRSSLEKIDLLIVDEAHQWYFSPSVKTIIDECRPTKRLLMTGTPSKFIKEGMEIIPLTINQIFDSGRIAPLKVEIACSNYDFRIGDFDSEGDLNNPDFNESDTKKTMDRLLKRIIRRLKTDSIYSLVNFRRRYLPTFKALKKTMIACRSIKQGEQVNKYLNSQGVKSVISVSTISEETDNKIFDQFKQDSSILVLVIVQRGILGFDYPELINVIDMTMSYNVDRVYQLMCRAIRSNDANDTKLFFKIAPTSLREYYKYIMTAVLCMSEESFYIKFNGKNLREMEIPVIKIEKKPREQGDGKKRKSVFKPIMFDDLMVFDLIKGIYHTGNDILEAYGFTTMQNVRNEFLNHIEHVFEKNEIIENARKYNTRKDWIKSSDDSRKMFSQACRKGWIEEATKHMERLHKVYSREEVLEDARKYKRLVDWTSSSRKSANMFAFARRNNLVEEATSHMKKILYSPEEEILEDAKKYPSISKWRDSSKKSANFYSQAISRKILDKACSHMIMIKRISFSKEEIFEDAKKYNTVSDWTKSSHDSLCMHQQAYTRPYYKEITSHMKPKKPTGIKNK